MPPGPRRPASGGAPPVPVRVRGAGVRKSSLREPLASPLGPCPPLPMAAYFTPSSSRHSPSFTRSNAWGLGWGSPA